MEKVLQRYSTSKFPRQDDLQRFRQVWGRSISLKKSKILQERGTTLLGDLNLQMGDSRGEKDLEGKIKLIELMVDIFIYKEGFQKSNILQKKSNKTLETINP